MQLTLKQIQSVTKGVAYITEETEGIFFHRFTKEQEHLYKSLKPWHFFNTLAPAGVKLMFKTDSRRMRLKIKTKIGGSRQYFSVDVSVNGDIIGSILNFDEQNLVEDYVTAEYPCGEHMQEFSLGEGIKTICVYLPCSVTFYLQAVELDDGAILDPIPISRKLLAYGDSITQGYDALRSYNRYSGKLSEILGAEEFNKAIGGAGFFPELVALKENFVPDYVTVAYGTNDWNLREKAEFTYNCQKVYETLSNYYPNAQIFAITPIWRSDYEDAKKMGCFSTVEDTVRKVTEKLTNVVVISGLELVPHNSQYFADRWVHPNDDGFHFYFRNLYNEIKKYL